jgi:hypothetical protein
LTGAWVVYIWLQNDQLDHTMHVAIWTEHILRAMGVVDFCEVERMCTLDILIAAVL